jgi:hypothetical protein
MEGRGEMPTLPTNGNHKERLKRIAQSEHDPMAAKTIYPQRVSDDTLHRAEEISKPPASDDGTELYKKRRTWSDYPSRALNQK